MRELGRGKLFRSEGWNNFDANESSLRISNPQLSFLDTLVMGARELLLLCGMLHIEGIGSRWEEGSHSLHRVAPDHFHWTSHCKISFKVVVPIIPLFLLGVDIESFRCGNCKAALPMEVAKSSSQLSLVSFSGD
ncbi:hypothetical protein KCU92_g135, partial [Aureobasidium melanogenum]